MGVETHSAVNNSYVRTNSHVVLYSKCVSYFSSCSFIPRNKMGFETHLVVNNSKNRVGPYRWIYYNSDVRTNSYVALYSKCAATPKSENSLIL